MSDEFIPEDSSELKKLVADLQAQIQTLNQKLEGKKPETAHTSETSTTTSQSEGQLITESDATLRRLVQRIAMILQAEKVVIMFYDRELGDLLGIPPAYGVEEDRLVHFRVRATHGVSGSVFRESKPALYHSVLNDPRTQEDPFSLLNVMNGITVPLVIEKRDDQNHLVDKTPIGVLHAFNKRHGEDFTDEDVRLLERLARNVGAIIANLQLYREVVEDR